MWVPFEALPGHSRLWIYGASQPLDAAMLEPMLQSFTAEWTAHRRELQASAKVLDDFFILLAVNEEITATSGCSIDKATHFMRDLESNLGIILLERLRYYALEENGIACYEHSAFAQALQDQSLGPQTIVADTLINKVNDLPSFWKPLGQSWHRRLFGL
jgi:hypothetical protein